jgi:hypothetical protein
LLIILLGKVTGGIAAADTFPTPATAWNPRTYNCYRATSSLRIDGRLDEEDWAMAPWSEPFVDIEGDDKPDPRFLTRVKMLWDNEYFYVAAFMEEPDVWATITQHDAVIYLNNDFELFIDPDGDNHLYYELEINALASVWDLLLIKPYRDGGPAVNAWDIKGLHASVYVDGTLNDPTDTDGGWTVEIALSWAALAECAHRPSPPQDGDIWHVNFSRVQWSIEDRDDRYAKARDSQSGEPLREDNWVWSPQGLIAMHYPEMWGLVRFSDSAEPLEQPELITLADMDPRRIAMQIYYRQKEWQATHGQYTTSLDRLDLGDHRRNFDITMLADSHVFHVTVSGSGLVTHVTQDGRLWTSAAD